MVGLSMCQHNFQDKWPNLALHLSLTTSLKATVAWHQWSYPTAPDLAAIPNALVEYSSSRPPRTTGHNE